MAIQVDQMHRGQRMTKFRCGKIDLGFSGPDLKNFRRRGGILGARAISNSTLPMPGYYDIDDILTEDQVHQDRCFGFSWTDYLSLITFLAFVCNFARCFIMCVAISISKCVPTSRWYLAPFWSKPQDWGICSKIVLKLTYVGISLARCFCFL